MSQISEIDFSHSVSIITEIPAGSVSSGPRGTALTNRAGNLQPVKSFILKFRF